MKIRTCIAASTHQRGIRTAQLTKRLGLYRSNISLMDAGKRPLSLKLLTRIARFLKCNPLDLLMVHKTPRTPFARSRRFVKKLRDREDQLEEGTNCQWVNNILLAWQRHYGLRRYSQ
ncbi:MAG: helix-turn-helix domain-containing protein [Candidatus Omnitrophica bacterium]|nr:helix-turn-helix domain-containing protein [Candidatus Omnitrophota bacterium]